jgi:nitrogenase molybdenum-cofactor synthesis protein NifE
MKGLYRALPPFSSDVSGACSVLFGLNGLVVVHEPACCTSSFTVYDEGGYYGSASALYSSELREIHVATGDDEALLRRLEAAARCVDRDFIALIGSPVPMIAGTDYAALCREAERRTGLPAIAIGASGAKRYDEGASAALVALAERFARGAEAGPKPSADILGLTGIDFGPLAQNGELRRVLEESGIDIRSTWSSRGSLDEIKTAGEADVNIVVSRSGLAAARLLESRLGTPYVVGLPIGASGPSSLARAVLLARGGASGGFDAPGSGGKTPARAALGPILVAGEQVSANALRACLRADLGAASVTVASFFGIDGSLAEAGDSRVADESEFAAIVGGGGYETVIGDPLLRELCPIGLERFVPIPHVAISGAFPWNAAPELMSNEGTRWILEEFGVLCS